MECCDKDRKLANYCADCGRCLYSLPALLAYLEKQSSSGRTNTAKWLTWITEIESLILLRGNIKQGHVESPNTEGLITMDDYREKALITTLNRCDQDRKAAAKILKIGERTVYRLVSQFRLHKRMTCE